MINAQHELNQKVQFRPPLLKAPEEQWVGCHVSHGDVRIARVNICGVIKARRILAGRRANGERNNNIFQSIECRQLRWHLLIAYVASDPATHYGFGFVLFSQGLWTTFNRHFIARNPQRNALLREYRNWHIQHAPTREQHMSLDLVMPHLRLIDRKAAETLS